MVVETPIQKGATMNNTMRYEMYKYIKPQDIEEAPQFVECYVHGAAAVSAAAPHASNLPSPYLAS